MFSPLRNRFGIPGAISVIALVFAMFGGAYAASNNSGGKATASAKAKRGPRGPKGATGPAGPVGPAGPAGAKGDTGAAGANGKDGTNGTNGSPGGNGTNGTNGKTVLNGTVNPTNAIGTQGDFYINTTSSEIFGPKSSNAGVWGAGTKLKGADGAPGAAGSPWVVGTAPAGVVMKGTWSIPYYNATAAGESVQVPISTGVPIKPITEFAFTLKQGENLPGQSTAERVEAESVCPGSASNPLPPNAGFSVSVCVYVQSDTNLRPTVLAEVLKASGGGMVLPFESDAAGVAKASGSWALITG